MGAENNEGPYSRVYKGPPPRQVEGYKPISSIPAKYETMLFLGPRERKGFGSEGRRFFDQEHDLPGPGTYQLTQHNPLEFKHDSIGKRGYGPMASRSGRFKHKGRFTGPGPGDYRAEIVRATQTSFNRAPVTANFHAADTKPLPPPEEEEVVPEPGPGAYTSDVTRTGKKLDYMSTAQSHKSAFKAPGHKLILSGNLDTPGPQKYQTNLDDAWDYSKGAGGGGSRAGTSSFAGRSMGSMGNMPAVLFLEEATGGGGPHAKSGGPGPGSYEIAPIGSIKTALEKSAAKPSPAFQQPEFRDRFGAKLHEQLPPPSHSLGPAGPGRTGTGPRASSPPKGVSAPFKSQSAGHAEYDVRELARAPGPAFYNPNMPPKHKSFHLNARKAFS